MVVYQNPVKVSADNITAGPLSRTTGHLHVKAPRGTPPRVARARSPARGLPPSHSRPGASRSGGQSTTRVFPLFTRAQHSTNASAPIDVTGPAFAREKGESFLAPALVDELKKCVPLLAPLATGMKQELPQFSVAVRDITVNRADIPAFTKTVKGRAEELPSWAAAARIGFAMAQSSAACERVFSLLIPCSRSSSGVPP
mmetsp:Transcript_22030/g.59419  ORF Transcript_22030/g.59419 Transcript_22030/m.59419 type:complete len:199 (+) Transcript_22030:267-863(+)